MLVQPSQSVENLKNDATHSGYPNPGTTVASLSNSPALI